MGCLFVALIAAVARAALAQQLYQPPRAADGHPDFGGTWGASFMTLLERPSFLKTLVLTPDEARRAVTALTKGTPDLIDPDFFVRTSRRLRGFAANTDLRFWRRRPMGRCLTLRRASSSPNAPTGWTR